MVVGALVQLMVMKDKNIPEACEKIKVAVFNSASFFSVEHLGNGGDFLKVCVMHLGKECVSDNLGRMLLEKTIGQSEFTFEIDQKPLI